MLTLPGTLYVYWPLNAECPFAFASLFDFPRVVEIGKRTRPLPGSLRYRHRLNSWQRSSFRAISQIHGGTYREFMSDVAAQLGAIMKSAKVASECAEFSERHFARCRTVGIHLRRTDVVGKKFPQSEVERIDTALWNRMMAVEPEVQFFLASDSRSYVQEWNERLVRAGRTVFKNENSWRVDQFRQTSGDSVLKDVILLSHCERILCSTSSSLLLIAERINNRPKIEIVKPVE